MALPENDELRPKASKLKKRLGLPAFMGEPWFRLVSALGAVGSVGTFLFLLAYDSIMEDRCFPTLYSDRVCRVPTGFDSFSNVWLPALSFALFGVAAFILIAAAIGGVVVWATYGGVRGESVGTIVMTGLCFILAAVLVVMIGSLLENF